jgi:hypothetical protein
MEKFKQLFEGYSNYKGTLLQDVLKEIEQNISKLYPNGKYTFKKQYDDMYIEIQIVCSDSKNNKNVSGVRKIDSDLQNTHKYKITINTYYEANTIEKFWKIIAHELTHVSQSFNNSLNFARYKDTNTYLNKKNNGDFKETKIKNMTKYYNIISHSKRPTEHEANLIGVLESIKRQNYDLAIREIISEPEYYTNFTNKIFLKKAYEYGLRTIDINNFISEFKKYLQSLWKQIFEIEYKLQRDQIIEKISQTFSIMILLNIEKTNLTKLLKICEIDELDEKNKIILHSYNPNGAIYQIKNALKNITKD